MRAAMAALLWLQLAISAGGQLLDEPPPLCGPEDVNRDGSVGVGDLLFVLSAFGGPVVAPSRSGDPGHGRVYLGCALAPARIRYSKSGHKKEGTSGEQQQLV